jgi:hypothetical protein
MAAMRFPLVDEFTFSENSSAMKIHEDHIFLEVLMFLKKLQSLTALLNRLNFLSLRATHGRQ